MLTDLVLENFKAFGGRRTIPIRPITFIFGPNSAGKSSIFQAILAMKETAEQDLPGYSMLQTRGRQLDLGSFADVVYRHGVGRPVEVAVGIRVPAESWQYDGTPLQSLLDWAGLEVGHVTMGVRGAMDGERRPKLEELRFYIDDTSSPAFSVYGGENVLTSQPLPHPNADYFPRLQDEAEPPWEPESTFANYVDSVRVDGDAKFWNSILPSQHRVDTEGLPPDRWTPRMVELAERSFDDVKLLFSRLRLTPAWPQAAPNWPEADDVSLPDIASDAAERVAYALSRVRYLGPLREPPQRYVPREGPATGFGLTGNSVPQELERSPDRIKQVNRVLHRLEIGFRLTIEPLSSRKGGDSGLLAVGLEDVETRLRIGLPDAGFGVSQVLPVVTQCVAAYQNTILVEQPELHLHPRLQANLADVFINTALGWGDVLTTEPQRSRTRGGKPAPDVSEIPDITPMPVRNTVLVETHSEHIILRLMRRMRETAAGRREPGMPPVRTRDVSIIYVKPTKDGAIPVPMELSEDGELLTRWPGGFFEEGFRERFS